MAKEIPLIDIEFGLAQLSGNETLLLRMISKFKNEFAKVPLEVEDFVNQGDFKAAQMKVHTTKGISGNLGLSAVFRCCKVLDQQLKEQKNDFKTISEFADLMQKTCTAITEMEADNKHDDKIAENSDDQQKTEIKNELINKLEQHEFITDSDLHNYLNAITLAEGKSKELKEAIESLDYETALTLLAT